MAAPIHVVTSEVCGRCKFSRANPAPSPGLELICKRMPPHASATLMGRQPDGQPLFMYTSYYACVGEHEEGCGEWKPKITITN
jgi:hypothetical protein